MTEAQTLTLADFLLARIDEDEQWAREELSTPTTIVVTETLHELAERMLAECEAKRQIVTAYREFVTPDADDGIAQYADDTSRDRLWPEYGGGIFEGLRIAARALALPYADHPDYREEWRP